MFIKSIKLNKKYIILISCFLIILLSSTFIFINYFSLASENNENEKDYIKWVDCNVSYNVLDKTSKLDISSHNNNENIKFNWIELIAYLSSKYYGHLENFKSKDLDELVNRLKNGETMESISQNMPNYSYYYECYDAIFREYIGEYSIFG